MKILWDGEFAQQVQHQTATDGRQIKIVSLLKQLSEKETIGINFPGQGPGWRTLREI